MFSNNWKCFYCRIEITKDNRTVDHLIPLCRDGPHIIDNLLPSCNFCNNSKHGRNIIDWEI
jgi:5-methylcytosine-specific restriction endonuclease McrA